MREKTPQRITLIARAGEDAEMLTALREAVSEWRERGHRVRVRITFESGDARRFAAAARRTSDVVVVAGGDGTINEVANAFLRAGSRPRLAIIPSGTANDLAAGLGLPDDPLECARLAIDGRAVTVDIAVVNRRAFLNVSVGGLGASATRDASSEAKRRLGTLAYLLRGAKEIAEATPVRARVEADGVPVLDDELYFFAVGNGRYTGGGTAITPLAHAADGALDLVVLRAVSRLELVQLLPEIRDGRHLVHPAVVHVRAKQISVRPAEAIAVNADGEPVVARNLDYAVSGEQVVMMVPRTADGDDAIV